MTKLEYFKTCTKGPWNVTSGYVSWKIVDNVMYFQQSKEKEDWIRNLSVIPTTLKIKGKTIFVPVGLDESWDEIKNIIKANPCDVYVGYSLGAQLAALASAYTGKPAIAYGCPNFFMGTKTLFDKVEFIQNKEDLISMIPPVYMKGKHITTLVGAYEYLSDISIVRKLSGHDALLYKARLGGI